MGIPSEDLATTFLLVDPGATLASLLRRLPPERKLRAAFYIIVPTADGHYLVLSWSEVEQLATAVPEVARGLTTIDKLAGIIDPVAAIDSGAITLTQARKRANSQPGRRLVVLGQGRVIGLLTTQTLGTVTGKDPFAGLSNSIPETVLSPDDPSQTVQSDKTVSNEDNRVFNAWIGDHETDQPLQQGESYELKFNVDKPKAGATTASFDAQRAFASLPPDQKTVEITVAIESADVTIIGDDQQQLVVPRTGKSKNTATFTIEPKHDGPCRVDAVFILNNRIFQKMTLTLQVGEAQAAPVLASETRGVTFASGLALPTPKNNISLWIERRDGGYQIKLLGGGTLRAFLNLSEEKIAELILKARDVLKGLVYLKSPANQYVYQGADTAIAPEIHAESLKTLAKLGYSLYQDVFFAPGNGPDAQQLGKLLRQISQQQQLQIEIVAERFIFPWALLYDRSPVNLNAIDPEGFWGFKHIVQYMPEYSTPSLVSFSADIAVKDKLNLGFVCNQTIDAELTGKGFGPVVAPQSEFFKTLDGVALSEFPTRADFTGLLNNPEAAVQLLYFYCHAVSNLPGEAGGVDGSKFVLTDGPISLGDLKFEAPIDGDSTLKQAPLIFINACQSAELSPYLYDGMIPYLVAKGFRGVVGTEVDTPALFAAEFGREFLKRFAVGDQPLGELLLALRREYLQSKNNVMGLLYALYSHGDVVVRRSAS